MGDYIRYTYQQFEETTKELKEIISTISTLDRPKSEDVWEVINIADGSLGDYPSAMARTNEGVVIRIELQDDGFTPYPVVELVKVNRKDRTKDWHAAYVTLSVYYIYPHQFSKIPELVEWLEKTEIPSPKEILDN